MQNLDFKQRVKVSADYLLVKRNPSDGGWGLNIEKGFQASSIVNTTESLFVINRAGYEIQDVDITIEYLRKSIQEHRLQRGDNLRYLTFGLWGLLEAGVSNKDHYVHEFATQIENRIIPRVGWSELADDEEVRIWPTFLSLWVLTKVFGREYVTAKFYDVLAGILASGRRNHYKWGFTLRDPPSLAATAYVLILLAELYPGTPDVSQARESVIHMLSRALVDNKPVEVEPVSGTDWHHYSYAWALKAMHSTDVPYSETLHSTTLRALSYVDSLFQDGKGFCEPGKPVCNVRSIFNNVLAIDAVIESFDPSNYFYLEQLLHGNTVVHSDSVFLSFSYQAQDVELVAGLKRLLEASRFTVITGEKNPMGSLSKSILNKIRQAEKFVVVMTCRDKKENGKFTTSSWLLEEKGAALALGKACLMLVEEGIDEKEIGGLQGDDQRVGFNRNNFTSAVAETLRMLQ